MTLENDFNTLITEMEDNLQAMGVLDAEFDSSTGLRGLSARILDIEPSVSGLNLETSLTIQSETEIEVGESVVISSKLNVFYDDETLVNVDLSGVLTGATINIKEGNNIIGTGITNNNGVVDISVSNLSLGTHNLKAVFTGTENFQECESNTISINVVTSKPTNIDINATKNILSYADTDSTDITVTLLNKSNSPVSGKTVTMGVYMEDDDSLLETLSVVDENDGTYTSTYSSKGVGDIYIKAECGSLVTESFVVHDYWKYIANGSYTGTSAISFQELYESSAYDNIEISATIKAPNKGFSLSFLKSKDSSSSIQDNIFLIGVDGANNLAVTRIENGNTTVYTSNLFQQYTANSDLNCVIRIENGVVTLKLNSYTYTSTPITGLKYIGVRNWNNAKTVTYTDFIVKPL